ncbi:MAG: IPTL-CTERM sorting domain-containing protein [Planctomycetota bacterium]|jgi:hypothetical protein
MFDSTKKKLILIALALASLLPISAQALVLYGTNGAGGNPSDLLILDPDTGAMLVNVGPTGYSHVTGLAVHPTTGVLYANANQPGTLLTINTNTGVATPIGPTGHQISDITFNAAGELYGWAETGGTDDPVSIDLVSGAATIIGNAGVATGSSAVEFTAGGVLLMKDHQHRLWEVNTGNGSVSSWGELVPPPSGANRYRNVMARHPGNDRIYFADRGASDGSGPPPLVYSADVDDTSPIPVTEMGTGPDRLSALAFDTDAELPAVARFKVTKMFSDGRNDEVGVMLTCTTGLPLSQPATIAGGDEVGVTFVVTNLDNGANCEVTESGVPSGYTAILNDGAGCSWTEVHHGFFTCEIYNQANPATFTVHKDWVVMNDGGDAVFGKALVTATCNAEIVGGDFDIDTTTWSTTDDLADGEKLVATVDTTEGSATCWASENVLESGVESEDDCGARQIAAGGSSSCTFTNTVFFEGIPTLSQYGLAIMALLMLGVGFVGFRRFV